MLKEKLPLLFGLAQCCGPYIANPNLEGNEEDFAPSQVYAFLFAMRPLMVMFYPT